MRRRCRWKGEEEGAGGRVRRRCRWKDKGKGEGAGGRVRRRVQVEG